MMSYGRTCRGGARFVPVCYGVAVEAWCEVLCYVVFCRGQVSYVMAVLVGRGLARYCVVSSGLLWQLW